MKKIKVAVLLTLMIVLLIGCASTNNRSDDVSNSTDTVESQKEENLGRTVDIFSGPGEDYFYEGKYDVDAFREYKDWYEVEYLDDKRGYVKKSDIKDIDVSSLEQVVSKLIVGPTERKQVLLLNETYTLTGEIELHEGPNDSSDVTSTVPKNETIKIINLEPVEKEGGLSSIDRFLYWQVEAETASGKFRGYVRSDDLFDYENPLKGFDDIKEKNAKISYEGNDYYSTTGAIIDGYLDNWHLVKKFTIQDKLFSFTGGIAGILGIDYSPQEILINKTMDFPTVEKGKKRYYQTLVKVDITNKKYLDKLNVFSAALDLIPAFIVGGAPDLTICVELQEYENERKIVLRTDSPFELQMEGRGLGRTFELSDLLVNAKGSAVGASEEVDKIIRKAYPNLKGEKKYSMKITFAESADLRENPYGHYLIIDKDLNVYTQLIVHPGTQAIIYYDGQPVYDATWDLSSLQQLDEATSNAIIELLMKKGFSFTKTESVSGEEQHNNAAQIAGENQTNTNDVIDKYKNFISAQNELLFYSIYDIDKDGYPELFFYENHPQERESFCDIYSYSGDEFKLIERTHGPGFWHVLPTYASYPNGNGIVEYGAVKGYEFVDVHTLNDGILNTEEVYYSREGAKYYLDSSDQTYYESQYNNPINHQYYQSETSSPYFEGSYLLGSNAKDNFTAVYEAFGVEEETTTPSDNNDNTFMGLSLLDPGVEISTASNGNTYRIRYESTEKSDEYLGLNLYVNDIAESYRLDAVYYPSIENVYVTDIDINDSYCNIVVVIYGEDDDSSTYIFAFNDNEIRLITEFHGRLVPESVDGGGKALLVYWIGMGIRDYGSFTVRPEISVHDLSAELVQLHSGRSIYSETGSTYEEEYIIPLYSDLTVYAEPSCISIKDTISAGNSVECEYVDYVKYDGSFHVTCGEISGYVTSSMLKASCSDIYFVG